MPIAGIDDENGKTHSLAHLYGSRAKMFGLAHFSISKGMLFNYVVLLVFCALNGLEKFILKPKPPLIQSSHAKRVTWSVPERDPLLGSRNQTRRFTASASQRRLHSNVPAELEVRLPYMHAVDIFLLGDQ